MKKENLGTMIAKLRKEKNLTQKELADLLYVSSSTVSKWEKGISVPDVYLFSKLTEVPGASVPELVECINDSDGEEKENILETCDLANNNLENITSDISIASDNTTIVTYKGTLIN